MTKIKVAPSLLSADFSKLGEEIRQLCKSGADMLHVDVMDGHFVPNLTIGPVVIKDIKKSSTVPLDVHLMMTNPLQYLQAFIDAGADRITLHIEMDDDIDDALDYLRQQGIERGICLKPKTKAEDLIPYLDKIDFVLIMTVEPGFGGQSFMTDQLTKISDVKKIIQNLPIDIEVDGGINDKTGALCVQNGADILVAGNYIFKASDIKDAILKLKNCEDK